jgi:hypothetical protein
MSASRRLYVFLHGMRSIVFFESFHILIVIVAP